MADDSIDDDSIDYDTYSVILYDIYIKSRQQALLDIDNELNDNNNDNNDKPKMTMVALKSGLKAVNFVYGEIDIKSFINLLNIVGINHDNEIFCDLGCGAGISLVTASMMMYYNKQYQKLMKFRKIIGIDLLSMKIKECTKTIDYMNNTINELRMNPTNDKYYKYTVHETPDINVILDNFLQYDWKTADVVYACATCFGQDLLSQLQLQLAELKVNSRVIILDSLILQSHDKFQLIETSQCITSWGTALAYIYKKIA